MKSKKKKYMWSPITFCSPGLLYTNKMKRVINPEKYTAKQQGQNSQCFYEKKIKDSMASLTFSMTPAPKLLMALIFFSDSGGLNWMAFFWRRASGTVTNTWKKQLQSQQYQNLNTALKPHSILLTILDYSCRMQHNNTPGISRLVSGFSSH